MIIQASLHLDCEAAMHLSSDVAFTPTVKAIQARKGSRHVYADAEFGTVVTPDLASFIATQRSFFLSTSNAAGQPYIQHRGGPSGFLNMIDEHTLAIADFKGNRQFISQGNLSENPKAFIFLIDYMHQRRVKIWGTAKVVEGDSALERQLMPPGYKARAEQAIIFNVEAWSANCPQHIPQRFEAEDVARVFAEKDARILELEAKLNERLRV
jgi:uncharacterized protein